MVFNSKHDEYRYKDKELILSLGGISAVAKLLKYDLKNGGIQRVGNWMTRGIPAQVKVDYPHIFLKKK
jgi:hypothetical protein